jgi:hypothetical protein
VARTLYHGTTVDNEASIRQHGLVGGVGGFVADTYGLDYDAEDIPALVFAANKQEISKALGAMTKHVGIKLGKNMHDVTDNDILNHGLLVIIYDVEDQVERRPEKREDEGFYAEYPLTVEPGDYFSEDLPADKFVKGRSLLRLLGRYGAWPRTWGGSESDEQARLSKMRGELVARWLRQNPEKTRQEALNLVQGLSDDKVMQYFRQYIGGR